MALAATGEGDDGLIDGSLDAVALVVGCLLLVAVAIASVEIILRVTRERRAGPGSDLPPVSPLSARRLYGRVLHGLAPGAVAGGITMVRTGRPATAVFVFAALALTGAVLRAHRRPLHLMPTARHAFNAFVPAAGMALVLIPGWSGVALIGEKTAVAALGGAVLTSFMADWLDARFRADRPIWLAVIGPASFADKLASELHEMKIQGYRVVGWLGDQPEAQVTSRVRWLGTLDDVRQAVRQEHIDLLVVAPQKPRLAVFDHAAKACLDLPVRMIEATALYEEVLGHVPIGTINSAWFQFIMHPRYSPSSPLSKRVLDLLVSGMLLAIALPLLLLCALLVKLEDRGPVFYRQRRVGEEGREFDMLKFRTMRVDADERRGSVPEEQLITAVGRVLRKLHLNELPQLAQVLVGRMTLVGPRPEPPELVNELSGVVPYYERRALVKPGLTGWAQVRCGYAGSHFGTAWKLCHDLYYIKHRSAAFDLLILVQTARALLEREGEEQMPAKDFILGEAVELAGR